MRKTVVASFVAMASTCVGGSIYVAPQTSTVQQGGAVSLSVNVSGIADLFAFQFSLRFDPAILQALSVSEGSLFSGVGFSFNPGTIDNNAGTVTFIADSLSGLGVGLAADGALATVTLRTVGGGTSAIALADVVLLDHNLDPIGVTTFGGSTTAIPEPGTSAVAAGLLAVLTFWRFGSGRIRAAPEADCKHNVGQATGLRLPGSVANI